MNNYSDRLHNAIPGGAHTYSRGDDQFPDNCPDIFTRGMGSKLYDIHGVEYLDYGMGLRSVNIGYGNKEIAEAAYNEALKGNNLTRASFTELEAAELFINTIPSVEMVKFAKHGSTVTTAAIKLARAYTGKRYILIPEEQPFFSFDDWFIGSTPITKGTLPESSKYTIKFKFGDRKDLLEKIEYFKDDIAGIMLEPSTNLSPCKNICSEFLNKKCNSCENTESNFLKFIEEVCVKNNIVFILDEMITGFRWSLNGAQSFYGVNPDLTTFGKAMANGYGLAALGGKKDIMQLGGILEEGKERVFLTSTTHGAEMTSLGAFIKTVEVLERENGIDTIWKYGDRLKMGMQNIINHYGLKDFFLLDGYSCSPAFTTLNHDGEFDFSFRTLFIEKMIEKKVLMPYIAICLEHKQTDYERTLEAFDYTMNIYSKALNSDVKKFLLSNRIVKPVFRKFN